MAEDNIVDKIRKLRAKEKGTDNEAEAALFAAKVQELLAKHGLEESVLRPEAQEELTQEKWEMQYCDSWHRQLCSMTARVYFCKIYVFHYGGKFTAGGGWKDKKGIAFVGRPNNVIIAKEMSEYLIDTTRRLGREYGREEDGNPEGAAARQFMRGCAARLVSRLYEMLEAQTQAAPTHTASGNPSNLPALYMDEHSLADKWIANYLGDNMKKAGRGFSRSGDHARAGDAAGRNINLSTQIGNKKGSLLS